ncbi:hypothetical protein [Pseudofrankia sp. DC12]|uniref:hypothetical protein n=1 Tax=Pseudofrankia sp. DC12 TaxID=683315 RepID=UPI000AA12115|nr:hypothetical protein [Pseudofrankia sp. DC12]
MASVFGLDRKAAIALSGELTSIRASLASLGSDIDEARSNTGAPEVEGALVRFVHGSADSRGNLDQLLARAIGLVNGLIDGTGAVDAGLARALGPAGAPLSAAPDLAGGLGGALGLAAAGAP